MQALERLPNRARCPLHSRFERFETRFDYSELALLCSALGVLTPDTTFTVSYALCSAGSIVNTTSLNWCELLSPKKGFPHCLFCCQRSMQQGHIQLSRRCFGLLQLLCWLLRCDNRLCALLLLRCVCDFACSLAQ